MHPASSPKQKAIETTCGMKDCTKNDFGECVATEKRRGNCSYLQLVGALKVIKQHPVHAHATATAALKAAGEEV